MESGLITSIIGIAIFSTLMFYGYKYASGQTAVMPEKQEQYLQWVSKYGTKARKVIIILSVIYGILMFFQLLGILVK